MKNSDALHLQLLYSATVSHNLTPTLKMVSRVSHISWRCRAPRSAKYRTRVFTMLQIKTKVVEQQNKPITRPPSNSSYANCQASHSCAMQTSGSAPPRYHTLPHTHLMLSLLLPTQTISPDAHPQTDPRRQPPHPHPSAPPGHPRPSAAPHPCQPWTRRWR